MYFYTSGIQMVEKGIFTSGEEQTDVKPKPKLLSPNPQVVVLLLIVAIKKDDNQDLITTIQRLDTRTKRQTCFTIRVG